MRIAKAPSLVLALALQVLPITRVFIATSPATGSSFAIVFTWIAGAAALLGSYDAVSGASTTITSPGTATATNGTPFSYRITTGPDGANTFNAAPLPSGLTVSTTVGRITGTPTVDGVFNVLLTASDNARPDRTVTKNLTLTILSSAGGMTNPPSITTQPTSRTVTNGGTTTFTVAATGTAPLAYRWRNDGAEVTGATNSTLTLSSVTTNHAGNYTVVITNGVGAVTSSVAMLTVLVRPSIATQPANQNVAVGDIASFTVAAHGTAPLSYQWRRNGVNLTSANSATLNLPGVTTGQAGNYTVVVANSAGSVTSSVATLTVYVVTLPFSLSKTGGGTLTGPTNGQLLELGKAYVLKAIPAAGNLFSNWIVSGQSVTEATLNITMASNLTVVANFVPTPFPGLKGAYSGLFHPATNDPPHEQSGYFTLAVTDKGTYSGKLLLNGGAFSISGALGLDLSALKTVLRKGTNEIYVSLQLSSGLDQVTGYVSNAFWVSELFGYRARFHSSTNPATNFLGKYTMLLSGSDDAATSPLGLGCATIAVVSSGAAAIKGTLADGTAAAQKGALAANGQLPVYVNLYRGKGSLFGWLTFTNTATNDIPGLLLWTRKDGVPGNYYPGGFTNETQTLASRYTPPAKGTAVLGFSNSVVLLEGANLPGPMTNDVFLSVLNKIAVTSTNTSKLALSITTSSGLLSGSFINPQTLKKTTIKGAVLQKQTLGGGLFLGTNQSGRVFFGLPADAPVFAP
jgi:hypothetical protein